MSKATTRKADGAPTKEVDQFRLALRPINELYRNTSAVDLPESTSHGLPQTFNNIWARRTF